MHLLRIVLILPALLVWQNCLGQSESVKYGNDFLNIGVGARAFGMGNAQVASVNDVTAAYWNPAGLVRTTPAGKPEIMLLHAAYFANIAQYNYGGLSLPLDSTGSRYLGITLIRLGIDDIPNTLNLVREDGSFDYNSVTGFSASDFALMLSYAWDFQRVPGLSMGLNFKVIYRAAGSFANAWGFGADLGLQYHRKDLRLGLVVKDLTQTFNAWTFNTETFEQAFINTANEIPQNSVLRVPPSVRFGIGWRLGLGSRLNLNPEINADIYFDGEREASLVKSSTMSLDPHAGIELEFLNNEKRGVAFLRGGVYNLQNVKNLEGADELGLFPTAGVGFVIKGFQIDYALANIGNLSENLHSHVVSIKFQIE